MDASEIPVTFACDEDWAGMPGDARRRHCARCDCAVVNLSAHTERGARRFLTSQPQACVRFAQDAQGAVRFRRSRLAAVVAGVLALIPGGAQAEAPPPPQATLEVTFRAEAETGALHIVVVDAIDELPIPNVQVEVQGHQLAPRTTNVRGELTLMLPHGTHRIKVIKSGFQGVTVEELRISERPNTYTVRMELAEQSHVTMGGIRYAPRSRPRGLPWFLRRHGR